MVTVAKRYRPDLPEHDRILLTKVGQLRTGYEWLYRASSPLWWKQYLRRTKNERRIAIASVKLLSAVDQVFLSELPAVLHAIKRTAPIAKNGVVIFKYIEPAGEALGSNTDNVPVAAESIDPSTTGEANAIETPGENPFLLVEELAAALLEQQAQNNEQVKEVIVHITIELAHIIKEAGEDVLEELGFGTGGFNWEHPQSAAETLFPELTKTIESDIRGTVKSRAKRISRMIVRAANPAAPKTIPEVVADVRRAMPSLTRQQATNIARTETAKVYGSVDQETYMRNGVLRRRWITAAGSPIVTKSPVCPLCVMNAEAGWVDVNQYFPSGALTPPAHNYCRCSCIPDLRTWLPPRTPFEGEVEAGVAA